MKHESKISDIIIHASHVGDKQLSRKLRIAAAEALLKISQDQHGIFQHYQGNTVEYPVQEQFITERGGKQDASKLYGVGLSEQKKTDLTTREYGRSLSTRYSPDRVGVMARRISDGVYQDPYTNRTYDWNEGFTTEDGEVFGGGSVALQTDMFSR